MPNDPKLCETTGWLREALDRAEAWVETWPPAFRGAMEAAVEVVDGE